MAESRSEATLRNRGVLRRLVRRIPRQLAAGIGRTSFIRAAGLGVVRDLSFVVTKLSLDTGSRFAATANNAVPFDSKTRAKQFARSRQFFASHFGENGNSIF